MRPDLGLPPSRFESGRTWVQPDRWRSVLVVTPFSTRGGDVPETHPTRRHLRPSAAPVVDGCHPSEGINTFYSLPEAAERRS